MTSQSGAPTPFVVFAEFEVKSECLRAFLALAHDQDGTLAIMAGGDATVFERSRGVLQTMGRPTRIGPAGTGQLAKLVNQMMVASTIATVAEAMLLAERGGADPAQVRAALLGGFADSTILRQHAARMITQDFQPGGPAKYQIKDTKTALGFAQSVGLELPVLQPIRVTAPIAFLYKFYAT